MQPSAAISTWEMVGLAVADCRQQSIRVRLQDAWQQQPQVWMRYNKHVSTALLIDVWTHLIGGSSGLAGGGGLQGRRDVARGEECASPKCTQATVHRQWRLMSM